MVPICELNFNKNHREIIRYSIIYHYFKHISRQAFQPAGSQPQPFQCQSAKVAPFASSWTNVPWGKHQIGRGKEGRRKNHETWNMFNLVWSSTFRAFTTFPFTRKFKSEGKAFLCIHASRLAGLGLLDLPGSTERLTPLLDFSVATLYPRKTLSAQAKSQCQDESFSMHWHAMTLVLQQFVRMLILLNDIWQFKAILTACTAVTAVWQKLFLQGHSLSWRTTSWERFGLFSKKCSWSACDPTTARTFSHWVGIASVFVKAC